MIQTLNVVKDKNDRGDNVQTMKIIMCYLQKLLVEFKSRQYYQQMGGNVGLCSTQPDSISQNNYQLFLDSVKYYDSDIEPVTGAHVDVYSFKEIFIHKKVFHFALKQSLQKAFLFILICAKSPTGVQSIFHISSDKDYKCKTNYCLQAFAEHLNFSLKKHLDNLIVKGVSLNSKQIFYILRQMVRASSYLNKKRLKVKTFDPNEIFLNSTYEVKVPLQNIVYDNNYYLGSSQINGGNIKHINSKHILYLSPEQMNGFPKDKEIEHFVSKNMEISRVFSLGMLIMQCATMLDGAVTYYDYFGNMIDVNKLNRDIKQLKNTKLAAVLSRMLQLDPRKRIKFKQLESLLAKFQQSMFQQYLLID